MSSSTLIGLAGANESPADTIRHLLARSITLDGVAFVSEGGQGDGGEAELTTRDVAFLRRKTPVFVKVFDGDTNTIESSNWFVYEEHIVNIQILGRRQRKSSLPQITLARDAINDVVLRNRKGPYQKSDGADSAILSIPSRGLDWRRMAETEDDTVTEYVVGEVRCRTQRSVTTA